MDITPAISMDAEEPLSKAVHKVRESGIGVLITKGKDYVGMIDEKQIAQAPADASKAKCGKYAIRTPIVTPSDHISKVVESFFAGRFKNLPVIDGKKILGTVSRWEVLAEMKKNGMISGMKVHEYMTAPVVTIDEKETVGVAKALMRARNIRRLVVTRDGRIAGITSFFDMMRLTFPPTEKPPYMHNKSKADAQPLSSFMRTKIETIDKDAPLTSAIEKMLGNKVAALIVNDGFVPIGILTTKDILEAVMRKEGTSKVLISGLHEFEDDAEEAYSACEDFADKVAKSMKLTALNVHVKKTGSQYSASAHIHGAVPLVASAEGWSLKEAITSVLDELRVQASKVKTKALHKKKAPE